MREGTKFGLAAAGAMIFYAALFVGVVAVIAKAVVWIVKELR